jgi:GntR family transcriptional regulator, transcriptional repressor for pyruvate dehydrogenase complex
MTDPSTPLRKPRSLAYDLVDAIGDRIRDGRLQPGEKLPPESAIVDQYGVSRTVVREALSHLQAARLVTTRHGIGTFVVGPAVALPFQLTEEHFATLNDVIAVLELRIGVETEAAALAAQRRTAQNLHDMRVALDAVNLAIQAGQSAVAPDFQFHLEIARATQNPHFAELMSSLGTSIIPRARLDLGQEPRTQEQLDYLRRVNSEHESIFEAIQQHDAEGARAAMRTHLANSRERRRRLQALGTGTAPSH